MLLGGGGRLPSLDETRVHRGHRHKEGERGGARAVPRQRRPHRLGVKLGQELARRARVQRAQQDRHHDEYQLQHSMAVVFRLTRIQ